MSKYSRTPLILKAKEALGEPVYRGWTRKTRSARKLRGERKRPQDASYTCALGTNTGGQPSGRNFQSSWIPLKSNSFLLY